MSVLSDLQELVPELRARAAQVERSGKPPRENLEQLARIGYFEACADAPPGLRRRLLDHLSSGCGTTAFLASQHEGVCRRLQQAGHPLLSAACSGTVWLGVCFAHLRRDPSPVECLEFRDHVVYSGEGPWFTGFGLMEQVMVGGATQDGLFVMALAAVNCPEIVVRPLPPLACMEATGTVSLHFNALESPRRDVLVETDAEGLRLKDMHSTAFQGARSLGAARAAAEFLPPTYSLGALARIESLHEQMDAWDRTPDWAGATRLRARALQLGRQVLEAAVVSVGGKSQLLDHPLQRLLREQAFYSTTQLTGELRSHLLESLLSGGQK